MQLAMFTFTREQPITAKRVSKPPPDFAIPPSRSRSVLEKVINWISGETDYHEKHEEIAKRRFDGTGEWFLETEEYRTWLANTSGRLWVTAMRASSIYPLVNSR